MGRQFPDAVSLTQHLSAKDPVLCEGYSIRSCSPTGRESIHVESTYTPGTSHLLGPVWQSVSTRMLTGQVDVMCLGCMYGPTNARQILT